MIHLENGNWPLARPHESRMAGSFGGVHLLGEGAARQRVKGVSKIHQVCVQSFGLSQPNWWMTHVARLVKPGGSRIAAAQQRKFGVRPNSRQSMADSPASAALCAAARARQAWLVLRHPNLWP